MVGLTRAYVSRIEGGDRRPSPSAMRKLSEVLEAPLEELMVRSGHLEAEAPGLPTPPVTRPAQRVRPAATPVRGSFSLPRKHALAVSEEAPRVRTIPLLDSVPAGLRPLEEASSGKRSRLVVSDAEIEYDPEAFGLVVTGDSMMDAGILDGDVVVVSPNAQVLDGDTVVVMLGEHDVSLKKIYFENDSVLLQPGNVAYRPLRLKREGEVEVLGKVVLLKRKMR